MINIGFWNVGANKICRDYQDRLIKANENLVWFINSFDLDLLAVCEFSDTKPYFLYDDSIRRREYAEAYHVIDRVDTRIFYSNKTVNCLKEFTMIDEDDHSANRFSCGGMDFNLSCVHLHSRLYSADDEKQKIQVRKIINCIKDIERKYDNRTIVVGDFNADPYTSPMLSVDCFHSLPDRYKAKNGRMVMGEQYDAFYNPMWNLYGDFNLPPGTYYYRNSDAVNQFWYMFDQVIIRPALIEFFDEKSLRIINETVGNKNGNPKKSDHFPIVFSLALREVSHG